MGGCVTRVSKLSEIRNDVIESSQESSNGLVPTVVKTKCNDLFLQVGTTRSGSNALLRQLDQILMKFLGIALINTSRLARTLAENSSSRRFFQGVGEDGEGVVSEQVKQSCLIRSGWMAGGIQHIAQTLSFGSGTEGTVPWVPLLPVAELLESSDVTFDPLLELISSRQGIGRRGGSKDGGTRLDRSWRWFGANHGCSSSLIPVPSSQGFRGQREEDRSEFSQSCMQLLHYTADDDLEEDPM